MVASFFSPNIGICPPPTTWGSAHTFDTSTEIHIYILLSRVSNTYVAYFPSAIHIILREQDVIRHNKITDWVIKSINIAQRTAIHCKVHTEFDTTSGYTLNPSESARDLGIQMSADYT